MHNHLLARGKAPDGKWFEGYYLYKPDVKHMILEYNCYDELIATQVDPNTVCQFTGFVDSDNIKIFENDIVEIQYPGGHTKRYLIWWNKEGNYRDAIDFDWMVFNGQDYVHDSRAPLLFPCELFHNRMKNNLKHGSIIQVIGNLYDNTELLGG